MIRICSQCGALLLEDTENCTFCDLPLAENSATPEHYAVAIGARISASASASAGPRASSTIAPEPEWRREVTRRLQEYRARRRRLHPDDSQSGLPFSAEIALDGEEYQAEAAARGRERPRQRALTRQRQPERMEIHVQPELDFSSALDDRAHPQTALVPVAALSARRQAGTLDAIFLALTYAGFLGLFRSLGGHIAFEKVDGIVYLTCFYLLYAQYFFLFTTFAGSTPGMQLRCLTIVRLDGTLPDTRQLLWRSFGYLLSGATLMLGYLWSLWDEDHFTWQDRISQTYITAAAPIAEDPFDVRPAHHTFAHK